MRKTGVHGRVAASIYRLLRRVRNKSEAHVVSRLEFLKPVAAAIDQAASFAEIVSGERSPDLFFAMLQEVGEEPRGDGRVARGIGIFSELMAQNDGRAVQRIVGSAGELDEAAPFEALAVGRAQIAEIGA